MTLKVAYIALNLIMLIVISLFGKTAIDKTFKDPAKRSRKFLVLIVGLLGWHAYIFITANTGVYQVFDVPPAFVYMLILPAFIFIGVFMRFNRNNEWIQNIPESWLIYYQSFRIVIESLFVFSVAQGIIHSNMTIEGYNYDMVFAASAILIGLLVFHFKVLPKKVALYWNYLGLAVIAGIIFIIQMSIFNPDFFGPDMTPVPTEMGAYPYVLVAGFLMPSAVFIHILSIVQLKRAI